MSNINQINPKIFTSSQFNPATLTSRMQEFIQVESQVRNEIDSIQQKKDRFREWTKSLGESPKIQEMFSKFDSRIQVLFQKLDQFIRLREEFEKKYLSDIAYTPLAGDAFVKPPDDDSQKSPEEIKSVSEAISSQDDKMVAENVPSVESNLTENVESDFLPVPEEKLITGEIATSQSAMEILSTEEKTAESELEVKPEVQEVIIEVPEEEDKLVVLEEMEEDRIKHLIEASFAEPSSPVEVEKIQMDENADDQVIVSKEEIPAPIIPSASDATPVNIQVITPANDAIPVEENQLTESDILVESDEKTLLELPIPDSKQESESEEPEQSIKSTEISEDGPIEEAVLIAEQPAETIHPDVIESVKMNEAEQPVEVRESTETPPEIVETRILSPGEEPTALGFEIVEISPGETEQPVVVEEKSDVPPEETTGELKDSSDLIEIVLDKTAEATTEPELVEEPKSSPETDLADNKISKIAQEVDEVKIEIPEEKITPDLATDTEILSFEINENILAEAIQQGHEGYENEPIENELVDVSPEIPQLVNESLPITITVPESVEADEKSIDILEKISDISAENLVSDPNGAVEFEETEILQIRIIPDSEPESEKIIAGDAPHEVNDVIPPAETVNQVSITETAENTNETSTQLEENIESGEYFFGSKDIQRPRPIELTEEEREYKNRIPKLPREIFEKKFPRGRVEIPSETEIKQSSSEANLTKDEEVSEGTRLEKLFNVKKIKSRFSLRKLMKTKEEEEAMEMERDVNQPETSVTNYEPEAEKIVVEDKSKASKPVQVEDKTVLYLGIDLGTSETTVAASNGVVETILSVIGKPKDVISQKLLKKEILFGMEALRNRLALSIYRPLEKGVIKDTDADLEAARELVKHVISLADPDRYDKVYAVIGAPARSSFANQQALMDAAREVVDAVMIVSEPFAVAYGEGKIYNSLIIDIGAGTTDICSLKGSMPSDEDQFTLLKAGDYIDNQLMETIKNRIQGAQITKELCKKWKEEYSFVIEPDKSAIVSINIEGKPAKVDITKDIQASCESIMPDIVTCVNSIIANFDPEFQDELKQNIMLAGGGSLIKNIDQYLERALRALGNVKVSRVMNPIEAGARGALNLAKDLTDDYWRAL